MESELILVNFGQFWSILACVIHTVSESECFLRARGRAESALLLSLCKVSRRKDSLPFPREKIDSGVFCGITGYFYPYRSTGLFLLFIYLFIYLFIFLNKVTYKNSLQLAHTGVCTKLKENTYNSQCTIVQFNNKHILEHVQS